MLGGRKISDFIFQKFEIPGVIYGRVSNRKDINSLGFYDDEHTLAKPKGVFRIVVIGDSIAAGQNVSRRDSFPEVLEQLLNQEISLRYEIISLAETGYSLAQEVALFQKKAFLFEPDLIIWSYCLNDPAHPIFEDELTFQQYSYENIHSRLAKLALVLGLQPLDILTIYRDYSPRELGYFGERKYDPEHPNQKGQRLIAEYLYQKISTMVPH